jgi:hypothetical protein
VPVERGTPEPVTRRSERDRRVDAARERFLAFYPDRFRDADYVALERKYKADAHRRWRDLLGRADFSRRLAAGDHEAIARDAIRIEARTNLLFSFEKIAIRDAVSSPGGAKEFAEGLFEWLYGRGRVADRFDRWRDVVSELPRRQTRVVTWPVLTAFGFIARPKVHVMLKPMVTRRAAREYGFDLQYSSPPRWKTYESMLRFGATVREDLADWKPRDLIDIQSFIWVLGSEEYD